jgi:hypothetical protein
VKKILVISYHWPPSRSAGAQRISLFCRYLSDFGYETVVLTSGAGKTSADAGKKMKGVRVHPVDYWFNPADWAGGRGGRKGRGAGRRGGGGAGKRVKEFLWLNLFVPDARIGWYGPSKNAIDRLVRSESFAAVLSTAPPYTAHLLGRYAKERHGLPWVADMRDPWVENHAYNTGTRLWPARRLNALLERRVLERADRVVCAMESQRVLLSTKVPEGTGGKFSVIHNGYDGAGVLPSLRDTGRFTISYFGTSYEKGFPLSFIDQLGKLIEDDRDLSRDCLVRVVGETPASIRRHLEAAIPAGNLEISPHLPHEKFTPLLYERQLLLLVVNEDPLHRYSLPSKLFEYLPTGNPVLGIGPGDHEAAHILGETSAGEMFPSRDTEGVERFIRSRYEEWRGGRGALETRSFPLYERRRQAGRLAEILDGVTGS